MNDFISPPIVINGEGIVINGVDGDAQVQWPVRFDLLCPVLIRPVTANPAFPPLSIGPTATPTSVWVEVHDISYGVNTP